MAWGRGVVLRSCGAMNVVWAGVDAVPYMHTSVVATNAHELSVSAP